MIVAVRALGGPVWDGAGALAMGVSTGLNCAAVLALLLALGAVAVLFIK